MIKSTQAVRRQQPMNCLSVFGGFVGLALKGLKRRLKYITFFLKKVVSFHTLFYNSKYFLYFVIKNVVQFTIPEGDKCFLNAFTKVLRLEYLMMTCFSV